MDDWSNRIDEEVRRPDLDGILSEAIDGLPADCRTALVLHDVENTSNPEIAAILGLDGPGVARRVPSPGCSVHAEAPVRVFRIGCSSVGAQ